MCYEEGPICYEEGPICYETSHLCSVKRPTYYEKRRRVAGCFAESEIERLRRAVEE